MRQTIAVVTANLQNLPSRMGVSAVVVVSMAGVVGVTLAVLAMAKGFEKVFVTAARPDRVIVLRAGESSGTTSAITREQATLLMDSPGFKRDSAGDPIVSLLKFGGGPLKDRSGREGQVTVRGVEPKAQQVWPEVRLSEGRWFTQGLREAIVGRSALSQYKLALGSRVKLGDVDWLIVGMFEAEGSLYQSELWADLETVMAAYSATGQYSSLVGMLEGEASIVQLKDAVTSNPRLSHNVVLETDHYAQQSARTAQMMKLLGYVVAAIMSIGALFAAVNTMYIAVHQRATEIATLRAIGFGAVAIVVSVMAEILVLCLLGAALGAALAYLIFNGYSASTFGPGFGQVTFAFSIDLSLITSGMGMAALVALVAGLVPAIRATRVPIAEALRKA